jgi:hypothetical protein
MQVDTQIFGLDIAEDIVQVQISRQNMQLIARRF